jgi:hypothetical protein
MRDILQRKFGEKRNKEGDICWVIGITGAGAEGISLKCCRSVHIMEPYWNNVRLDQVKGRAIRICSHKDLPFDDRTVDLYTYYTIFSQEQLEKNKIDTTIFNADKYTFVDEETKLTRTIPVTSDQNVFLISSKKDKVNKAILTVMKESAVDCKLNSGENDSVKCLRIGGRPDLYMFDPDLAEDKIQTLLYFKQATSEPVESSGAIEKALGAPAPMAGSDTRAVGRLRFKGIIYFFLEKKGSGGSIINLYEEGDTSLEKVVGEARVEINTGKIYNIKLI